MSSSPGLFDFDERLQRLSDIGDQLEAYGRLVDFEIFRPPLDKALNYGDRSKGGRPPMDPVLMFKILIIQAQNNLSDERAEFLINDRLSFMRFLGLGLTDRVPPSRRRFACLSGNGRPNNLGVSGAVDTSWSDRDPVCRV